MNIYDIYEKDYREYCELVDNNVSKYTWAACNVFDLTTYDGKLDELFVKKIIEVCKVILNDKNYEYIEDENNYITYVLVCQLLVNFNWVDWGVSIRGAWFQESNLRPILTYWWNDMDGYETVDFTVDNLKTLIEFIEK